jgi:hypothetical protein
MGTSTTNDLKNHLREHLQFIRFSSYSFDKGFEGEAKRLAVSARVLLHNTPQSHSLMGQLGLLDIPFYSTASPWDSSKLGSHLGLLNVRISPSGSSYHAPFDDRPAHILILSCNLTSTNDILPPGANYSSGGHNEKTCTFACGST